MYYHLGFSYWMRSALCFIVAKLQDFSQLFNVSRQQSDNNTDSSTIRVASQTTIPDTEKITTDTNPTATVTKTALPLSHPKTAKKA
jgi:hypothetical protein